MNEPIPDNTMNVSEDSLLQIDGAAPLVPRKKKQKKKWLIGLAIGLFVLLAAFAIALTAGLFTKPARMFGLTLRRSSLAVQKSDLFSLAEDLTEDGRISLSVDFSEMDTDRLSIEFLKNLADTAKLSATVRLQGNAEDFSMQANLQDKTVLDLDLLLKDQNLVAGSTSLLGKTNYGVNLKTLARELPDSLFAPGSGSDYALPQNLYNFLMEWDGMIDLTSARQTAKTQLRRLGFQAVNAMDEYGEIEKSRETITVGSSEIRAQVISIEMDGAALCRISKKLIDWMRHDDAFRDFLRDNIAKPSLLTVVFTNRDAYERDLDAASALESLFDYLETLQEKLESYADSHELNLVLTGYIKGFRGQMVQLDVRFTDDGEKTSASLIVGPNPQKPESIIFSVKNDDGRKTSLSYTREQNDSSRYEASIRIRQDSETLARVQISWDKNSGAVFIKGVGQDENTTEIVANLKKDSKLYRVVPKSVSVKTADGEKKYPLNGLLLEIEKSSGMPTVPAYTQLISLDKEGMVSLTEDVKAGWEEALKQLLSTALQTES